MKKDHKNALVPYLSPLAVLALSFGYAVGWGSFVMPPIRYTLGDAPKFDILLTDITPTSASQAWCSSRSPSKISNSSSSRSAWKAKTATQR